uniref:PRC-barrel domain containing protein n=1 Tax=Streptomyces sp. NBC_01401 TaxID=2903854 RepID=A0AAU3H5G4_9ACTN
METVWAVPAQVGRSLGDDVIGYGVEAEDGSIGTVVRLSPVPGFGHLVIDAGVWRFGRSVVVPAGLVTAVDDGRKMIKVGCTKDQIKDAPRFERDQDTGDLYYLRHLGAYYESLAAAPE